jgi:hypothetical protein
MAELDRCPVCASAHLVRRLGEVECRDCGFVSEPSDATGSMVSAEPVGAAGGAAEGFAAGDPGSVVAGGSPAISARTPDDADQAPGLAEEVERALARVLGRAGRTARIG